MLTCTPRIPLAGLTLGLAILPAIAADAGDGVPLPPGDRPRPHSIEYEIARIRRPAGPKTVSPPPDHPRMSGCHVVSEPRPTGKEQ